MSKVLVNVIRWIARIVGLILFLFLILLLFGEGFPNVFNLSLSEQLLFVAVGMMEIGVLIAFKWELVGSLLLLGGYTFFAIVNGSLIAGPVFPIFFVVGISFLFCWWQNRKNAYE